ncbi:hypothetical protein [Serratia fonticola]|uniref:hypothetical protein n=1 Tax=Serratia fonticola TaxID=47917 RepID=UPI003AADE60B
MDFIASASYSDIVATIAMIVAVVAVPASGYISYHFAIKGERRKEFNLVADPMAELLILQNNKIKEGELPKTFISEAQIASLLVISKEIERKGIESAFAEYQKAQSECGNYDGKRCYYDFHSPSLLEGAIKNLMRYVQHK